MGTEEGKISKNCTVYIGLGSNLNNPIRQVTSALSALDNLPKTYLLTHSSLYRNPPLGLQNQPNYINAVAMLMTRLSPLVLLKNLQRIEKQQGRTRNEQRWSARTLDLDLLLYENEQSQNPVLTLPHSGIYNRSFVLCPLFECTQNLVLPNGQAVRDLVKQCDCSGLQKVI